MKRINVMMLFSILVCLILIIPASFAQDNETVSADDNVTDYYFDINADSDGNGSCDAPFRNFTDKRVRDNSTIHLSDGEYVFEKNRDFRNVSFNGRNPQNTILNGNGTTLTIRGIVSFSNLTLTNFIITNEGNLTAFNTVFTQLIPTKTSHANTWGGALYAGSNKNIRLDNCSFFNNTAEYGGALYVKGGNMVILNSLFYNNLAYNYGGAIACESVNVVVNNTRFSNHKSQNDAGGAIYLISSSLKAFNMTLTNASSTFGAAITALSSSLNIKNSTFTDNCAGYEGGAIYEVYGSIILDSSRFTNNTARNGGALFIDDVNVLRITGNNFIKNTASNYAGAIYYLLKNNINLTANNFTDNFAADFNDIYNTSSVNLNIGSGNYTLYILNHTQNLTIPDKYDLRDYGFVTQPKNQKAGGNCWAFAALASLESCILKASGEVLDLSEENMKNLMALYSDYGFNNRKPNNGGDNDMPVAYLVSWLGPVSEHDDEYDDCSHISTVLNSIAHVQNVIYLKRDNYTDNNAIKETILKYGAVATTMYYLNDKDHLNMYLDSTRTKVCYYYHENPSISTNHAVTIVGWDDSVKISNAPGLGAWIVKNSWGDDWFGNYGANGYFYASYYDVAFARPGTYSSYTFILNDTQKFDKNYQHEISGPTDYFYAAQNTIWYENAFYATDNEFLAGVSTYFNQDTDWEFYIYVNSLLQLTQRGSSTNGYYTFNLDYSVPLVKGDLFEVLFRITTRGDVGFPISEATALNKQTYGPGMSFVSNDGVKFQDLYNLVWLNYPGHFYLTQVACIKAFTQLTTLNPAVKDLNITYDSLDLYNLTLILLDENNNTVKNGEVIFTLNGANHTVKVHRGIAFLQIPFVLGVNNITWTYSSPNYHTIAGNAIFEVMPIKLDVNVTVGQDFNNAHVNFTFSQSITENLTVTVNGINRTIMAVNGTAYLNLTDLEYGEYNITVRVDNEIYDCTNTTGFFVDVKRTYLNVTNMTTIYRSGEYYRIQLLDEFNQPVTKVRVRVVLNGFTYMKFADSEGCLLIKTELDVGNYTVDISFSGNESYHKSQASARLTINPSKTNLNITSIVYDSFDMFSINASLTDQFNKSVDDGEVVFRVNDEDYPVNITNGTVSLKTHFILGKNNISVSFSHENYCTSFMDTIFEVSPIRLDVNVTVGQDFNNANVYFTFSQPISENITVGINGVNKTLKSVNGYACLNLTDLDYGMYNVTVNVEKDIYESKNQTGFFVDVKRTFLNVSDIITVYNSGVQYDAVLLDQFGLPVAGREVRFMIGNYIYSNTTDENGTASININLKDNIYPAVISFEGDGLYVKSQNTSQIIVKSSIIMPEIKNYALNSDYMVYLLNKEGNALNNTLITVNINNKNYYVETDINGKASFTIPLKNGKYDISITNTQTNESVIQNINIVNRIISNHDMIVYYGSNPDYIIRICDDDGKFAKDMDVEITLNNKVYHIKTDKKGYAILKITLKAGTYKITSSYKGFAVTNKITIKPTLITKDKKVKKAKRITYQAKLLKTNGKAFKGKKITFKIKGKTYKAKTNKNGIAKIKIKNLKVGKYKITSKYGKLTSISKITVKK